MPPAPGLLRLVPARYAALPGWAQSDPRPALAAFRRSCARPRQEAAVRADGRGGLCRPCGRLAGGLRRCSRRPPPNPPLARAYFEQWFQPVAVAAGEVRAGLFTGYYEPQLKASHTRHGPYRTPVYGLPDDLDHRRSRRIPMPEWAHEHIAGRVEGHRLVPYPDRADIDRDELAHAPVLFYAEDPVAVFFLHIQGSGRVVFDDGGVARVAYAAQNGRPYTAIGRTLIDEGAISREEVTLPSIRAWLKAHPRDARRVMETNRSYVFFKLAPLADPALGAAGSEGVPLTPGASLAVDLRLHPMGVPFFVAATAPDPNPKKADRPFDRLLVAQDTGGAIRGAVRGDVFWGFGADAQAIAGRMKAHGRLFVLLPKALAARLGDGKDFPGTGP